MHFLFRIPLVSCSSPSISRVRCPLPIIILLSLVNVLHFANLLAWIPERLCYDFCLLTNYLLFWYVRRIRIKLLLALLNFYIPCWVLSNLSLGLVTIKTLTRSISPVFAHFPFCVTLADVSRHIKRSDNLSSAVQPFCLPLLSVELWTEFTEVYL